MSKKNRSSGKQKWFRDALMARANRTCEQCGHQPEKWWKELFAHHIIPRSQGGKSMLDNGVILCKPCHDDAHLSVEA